LLASSALHEQLHRRAMPSVVTNNKRLMLARTFLETTLNLKASMAVAAYDNFSPASLSLENYPLITQSSASARLHEALLYSVMQTFPATCIIHFCHQTQEHHTPSSVTSPL
jgi:hypothetical protein